MSSWAAFFALTAISYAQAFALSFAMEVIIRFGTGGLFLACIAWAMTLGALAIWHARRLLWISPQLLVLVGLIKFLEEQSHCPPPFEWCIF